MTAFSIRISTAMGVLLISCVSSYLFEKRWVESNSWDVPSNWKPPRLPCHNDKIVLAQDVVYIENNVTIKSELNLPANGEIIMGPTSTLIFEENSGRSCLGEKMTFIGQRKKNWLNPMNWDIYRNGKKDEYMTKASPYIKRVPCINDQVSFPKGGAFEIDIRGEITIKEVILDGQVVTDNSQFQSYLATKEGKARFNFVNSRASLKLDSTIDCGNPGCKCGNDMLVKKICKKFKCPKTCAKKVKPENDCCYHCGALIDINIDQNFHLDECWTELRSHLLSVSYLESSFAGVRLYMYPIGSINSKIQILVSEDNNGSNAEAAADSINGYIKNSSKMCGGMKTIKVMKYKKDDVGTPNTTIIWAVILTIFFLTLAIIVVAYFWRKRYPSIGKRQKFDNENDFTQFPGADDVHETGFASPDLFPGTTQFANPLYECGGLDEINEVEGNKNDDVASPEYAIPIDYYTKKRADNANEEPRYVGGLTNPTYNLDTKLDPDCVEVDNGNSNPLYAEVMKEFPDKLTPVTSEVDLHSMHDTDSINNLELKVKDPSDSEEDIKQEMEVPVEEIGNKENVYSTIKKTGFEETDS